MYDYILKVLFCVVVCFLYKMVEIGCVFMNMNMILMLYFLIVIIYC